MELFETSSTYPPTTTQPPPSTPTASTGFPASTDLFSLILVLVVVGTLAIALAWRVGTRREKRLSAGSGTAS